MVDGITIGSYIVGRGSNSILFGELIQDPMRATIIPPEDTSSVS
jgi:hypothetical protein